MNQQDSRLEDLAAQVMSRSTILTSEQVAGFRVAIARMEGKLDAALALRGDFEAFEEETRSAIRELELKAAKQDSFKSVALWVAGVMGTVLAGLAVAVFTFILNRGA